MGVFSLVFFKINLFIHFFVSVMNDSWLLRVDFSLVVASRGYTLVVVHGPFTAVPSLVAGL